MLLIHLRRSRGLHARDLDGKQNSFANRPRACLLGGGLANAHRLGVDDAFVSEVPAMLNPGNYALLVLVRRAVVDAVGQPI
jgi:hypothetical protein